LRRLNFLVIGRKILIKKNLSLNYRININIRVYKEFKNGNIYDDNLLFKFDSDTDLFPDLLRRLYLPYNANSSVKDSDSAL